MLASLMTHAGHVQPGTRIRIGHLDNGSSPIQDNDYDGRTGTVTMIDDIGGIHGTWGGLSVFDEDDFTIISQ